MGWMGAAASLPIASCRLAPSRLWSDMVLVILFQTPHAGQLRVQMSSQRASAGKSRFASSTAFQQQQQQQATITPQNASIQARATASVCYERGAGK